ncbi:MAG: DNA-binding transcriptional LysR family regulator [Saprospiraceae bacterium]|jgi:DNA-binding transcriptional LysR family regulator
MLQAAEQMEGIMVGPDRQLVCRETGLHGELRVTTTDSFAFYLLGPPITSFSRLHPEIELELIVINHHLSLSKCDADISIRPTNKVPDSLLTP